MPRPLAEYTANKYPNIIIPIVRTAIRTAEIDLDTFLLISDELETEYTPPKTVLMTSTMNCASTLLGNMLHHNEYTTIISEHHSLINLSIGYTEGYWSPEDIRKLLPAVIKCLRKHVPENKVLIIKCTSTEIKLVPLLKSIMKEIQVLFMYKKNGYKSVEESLSRDPDMLLLMKIYNYFPYIATLFGYRCAVEGPFFKELKPTKTEDYAMIMYGSPYYYYTTYKALFDYDIVWQHELINDPDTTLTPIYQELKLPLNLLLKAKEYLRRYSSNGFIKTELRLYADIFNMEPDVSGLYND